MASGRADDKLRCKGFFEPEEPELKIDAILAANEIRDLSLPQEGKVSWGRVVTYQHEHVYTAALCLSPCDPPPAVHHGHPSLVPLEHFRWKIILVQSGQSRRLGKYGLPGISADEGVASLEYHRRSVKLREVDQSDA